MNIQYPIHERENHQMLWLLAAAVILASLVVVSQAAQYHFVASIAEHSTVSVSQAIYHPIPVPEPPHSEQTIHRVSSTPVPQGIQPSPVLQTIPTPASGQ